MFGFLIINKPVGPTSHDIVARVRRLVPRKTKVGHAGTLDPFADGVVLVGIGHATRLIDDIHQFPKTYRTTVTLGARSDSGDPTGEITPTAGEILAPSAAAVESALEQFRGVIDQVPPAHSAIHIDGKRAYELARAGETVDMPTRTVTIHELTLLRHDGLEVELEITCSTGTYIRSIARDLGEALGLGGYCSQLRRTSIGPFDIAHSIALDELSEEAIAAGLLPATLALRIPILTVGQTEIDLLQTGSRIPWPDAIDGRAALVDAEGTLLALVEPSGIPGILQPKKVFCITK